MSRELRTVLEVVPDWYLDAACTEVDPEIWFPGKGQSTSPAKRVCALCPVRPECLAEALQHPSSHGRFGIWGGTSERERRALVQDVAS